jgi:hypothetical protein
MELRRHLPLALAMLATALAARPAPAQEPSPEVQQELDVLEGRIDSFFRSLTDKSLGPERALRELIGNGPLKERNDDISKLIDQALTLDQRFGLYTGHERVAVRAVGNDLVLLRFLYKGDRFPVVWYFAFYRPAAIGGVRRDWSLISVRFDAKVELLDR